MLHHQGLLFVSEAIWIKLISRHHDNLLASHFSIKKTRELLAQNYFWPTFCHNIKAYMKGCDICLAFKAVRHKFYSDLQSLLVSIHQWKDLLIDFVTGLSISTNWKRDSYNFILVIVDWLTKIVPYKPVKITINASRLAEVIINISTRHNSLTNSIMTNKGVTPWSRNLLLCDLARDLTHDPPTSFRSE